MRKFLLLFVLSSIIFTSCVDKKITANEIVDQVTEQNVIPHAKRYDFWAADHTDRYLDEDLSEVLYGCNIYDYCSDFAVSVSKKDIVSELHILVAQSEEAADHLKNLLEKRVDVLRDKEIYLYDMENAENINAMIYINGLYVCLAAGQSSEIMYEKLEKMLE